MLCLQSIQLRPVQRLVQSVIVLTLVLLCSTSAGTLLHRQESEVDRSSVRSITHDKLAPIQHPSRPNLQSLPAPLQARFATDAGQDNPVYHFSAISHGRYQASNPNQGLEAMVDAAALQLRTGNDTWMVRLKGLEGQPQFLTSDPPPLVLTQANRLESRWGDLTAWYVNGPLGLEQGWTLARRPSNSIAGRLTLELAQSGNLHSVVDAGGRDLTLLDDRGLRRLRYGGLQAYDANGQALPIHFEIGGQHATTIQIVVDDRGAVYPLTVDPWGQAGQLFPSDGGNGDEFGFLVAASEDGSTVVVGAPFNAAGGTQRGAVYVYERPLNGWTSPVTQTAKLTLSSGTDGDDLGYSVGIGSDGSTIVAGAPQLGSSGGTGHGAAYVFVRRGRSWTNATESAKLTASDGAAADRFGYESGISADGSTITVGAPSNAAGGTLRGAAYVFVKPANGWINAVETAKLTASGGADNDQLGFAVGIDGNGSTVVAGAPVNAAGGTQRGAAYVFVKPASGWTNSTQKAKLTASDAVDNQVLGFELRVSEDGTTVAVGAPRAPAGGTQRGAVYVFVKPATDWIDATQNAKLTASDSLDGDQLGYIVGVTKDGSTVIAGAPQIGNGGSRQGSAYLFTRPSGGWANTLNQSVKLIGSGILIGDRVGQSVAISGDGLTAVVGAPGNNNQGISAGSAYIFGISPTFTSGPPPSPVKAGSLYNFTFHAEGSPPILYIATGNVPPGLKLNPKSGLLAGRVTTGGSYRFIIAATNNINPPAVKIVTIVVTQAPSFTNAAPTSPVQVTQPYSFTFTVNGYPKPTFSVTSGTLPPGLTLNATSGVLSGAPTTPGTFNFTVTASNDSGPPASQNVTIVVTQAAAFTSGAPPSSAKVGTAYTFTFTSSGSPASTFSVTTGALPPGLTLNATTGVLSGTPTTPGSYTFTVTANNGVNPPATQQVTIVVTPGGIYLPLINR